MQKRALRALFFSFRKLLFTMSVAHYARCIFKYGMIE